MIMTAEIKASEYDRCQLALITLDDYLIQHFSYMHPCGLLYKNIKLFSHKLMSSNLCNGSTFKRHGMGF